MLVSPELIFQIAEIGMLGGYDITIFGKHSTFTFIATFSFQESQNQNILSKIASLDL